jgi:hypothetical protein
MALTGFLNSRLVTDIVWNKEIRETKERSSMLNRLELGMMKFHPVFRFDVWDKSFSTNNRRRRATSVVR